VGVDALGHITDDDDDHETDSSGRDNGFNGRTAPEANGGLAAGSLRKRNPALQLTPMGSS